jgi:upstream activation factor subunit UAF30
LRPASRPSSSRQPQAGPRARDPRRRRIPASPPKTIENPMATKKAAKKVNPALMKPVQPDEVLAAVVGSTPMPRGQITKKLWDYIKKNGLQDTKVKTNIKADDKLKAIFGGKAVVTMFEMTKLVSKHIKA